MKPNIELIKDYKLPTGKVLIKGTKFFVSGKKQKELIDLKVAKSIKKEIVSDLTEHVKSEKTDK